jgi:signal transduction histidine kinase
VLLGFAVALVVVLRLRFLERRSDDAEAQMRQLSQQVVLAQEEERRHLSRELHDHVAQVLTGLRMELGRLERMSSAGAQLTGAVAGCKQLVDELFGTVRGLALGLRPSMLDDFGLQAALEWHVRDFMRRYALDVELLVGGDVDALPDQYRTCVYRVIQEALTNCARHARASRVEVSLMTDDEYLHVRVADNGIGLQESRKRAGLGLRGIEERVKDLGGTVTITSKGRGTAVSARLPLPVPAVQEATLARVAG